MRLSHPNYIELKTTKSPTASAVNKVREERLKPFFNDVYQYLKLKNWRPDSMARLKKQIQEKANKDIAYVILNRRIKQQTLPLKAQTPLEKKRFHSQTSCSSHRRKSIQNCQQTQYNNTNKKRFKVKLSQKFLQFRSKGRSLSQSLLPQKRQYNILQKTNKLMDNHFLKLQLGKQQLLRIENIEEERYKVTSNQWIQNILITNQEELESLIRFQKSKYFRKKGSQLNTYKGIKNEDIRTFHEQVQKKIFEKNPVMDTKQTLTTVNTLNLTFNAYKNQNDSMNNARNNVILQYERSNKYQNQKYKKKQNKLSIMQKMNKTQTLLKPKRISCD